jgi:hypothetical protein
MKRKEKWMGTNLNIENPIPKQLKTKGTFLKTNIVLRKLIGNDTVLKSFGESDIVCKESLLGIMVIEEPLFIITV